jgi:hypothetical protein
LATGGGSVGPQPIVNVIASNERPMNWMENRNIDLTSKKNEKVGDLIVRPPNAGFQTVSPTFCSNFTPVLGSFWSPPLGYPEGQVAETI